MGVAVTRGQGGGCRHAVRPRVTNQGWRPWLGGLAPTVVHAGAGKLDTR
jgi:hypothetical protein